MRISIAIVMLAACAHTAALRVDTDRGALVGLDAHGVRSYLGIPYAAPPVGDLRWAPPAPAPAWTAPRDATHFGHACAQSDFGLKRDTSEDCLTLDVWVPDGAARAPVMVWIHGGAFVLGATSDPMNDGAALARRTGAIVVTMNYRLGALGWLGRAYGFLNQRAALVWVQRNIAAFGGDPANVTLFGESAGAWSTCAHLASPGSRGLFARAIMQSGACADALYIPQATADAERAALAAALGCADGDLACLRAKPADAVLAALPGRRHFLLEPGVWWGPIVGGEDVPRLPLDAIRAGDFAHVPLMIGWNQAEGVLHTMSFDTISADELAQFVRGTFGAGAVAAVVARYAHETPKQALTDVVTDGIFACNDRRAARAVAAQGVPVYAYEFVHPLDDVHAHALGATHSVDLWFLWGNVDGGIGLSAREQPLSRAMMDAWGRFARTGDPGGRDLAWPRYDPARDELLQIDLAPRAVAHVDQDVCDFWDSLSVSSISSSASGTR